MGILDRLLESAAAKKALQEGAEVAERGLIPQAERSLIPQVERGLVPTAEERVLRDVTPSAPLELPPGSAIQEASKTPLWDMIKNNKSKIAAGAGGIGLAGLLAKYGGSDLPPAEAATQGPLVSPMLEKPIAPVEEKKTTTPLPKVSPKSAPSTLAQKEESEDVSSFTPDEVTKTQTPEVSAAPKGENVATVEALKQAQDKANTMRLIRSLQEAGSQFADGQSLQKHDDSTYQHNLAQADQSIKDLDEQIAMQSKDPNSAYSQGLRDYIQTTFGYNVPSNVGGEDLKTTFLKPIAEKFEADQKNKQFSQTMDLNKDKLNQDQSQFKDTLGFKNKQLAQQATEDRETKAARLQSATEKFGQKQAMVDDKDLQKLAKEIDPYKASSRSPFGVAAKNAMAVQNVRALLGGQTDYNDIDNRQVVETAKVLDRILSQGSPTISGSEHLTPDTARMKIAKLMEYASSKRKGAGAGDFIKNMEHTFNREYDVAKKQILASQKTTMRGYKGLSERRKADVDDLLQQATGFSPDELRETDAVSEGKGAQPKLRVTNGKETLEIDPSDLKHAIADGYQQVK